MSNKTAEQIAEEIHISRFDDKNGKFRGPNSFYAGMLYAEQIACTDSHPGRIHGQVAEEWNETVDKLWNEYLDHAREQGISGTVPDELAMKAVGLMFGLGREDQRHADLLTMFRAVDREWAKGKRCPVCGKADGLSHDEC